MYKIRIKQTEDDLDPRSKMVEKVTLIFVGAVIYGIALKIVFF